MTELMAVVLGWIWIFPYRDKPVQSRRRQQV